jgi:Predicted CoA-binding protein
MNDKNLHALKIEKFLANKNLAIAGASRNTDKFGYKVFEFLRSKGYKLYPIHPEAESLDGTICYKKPSDIPPDVRNLYVVTPQHATDKLIESAVERGFDMIWMQQKSETPNSVALAKNKGIDIITNRCIFMYIDPKGGHAFHRFFIKLFGKL